MDNDGRYTCRLFVGGVPPGVKTSDVKDIFDKYGEVLDIFVNRHFAFVQFNDKESAEAALRGENGKPYFGSRFDIQFAKKPKAELEAGGPLKPEIQNRRWTPYDKREDYFDKGGPPTGYGQNMRPTNDWNDKFGPGKASSYDSFDSYNDTRGNYKGGRDYFEGGPSANNYKPSSSGGYGEQSWNLSGLPSNRGPGNFQSDFERPITNSSFNPQPTLSSGGYNRDPPQSFRGGQGSLYSGPLDAPRVSNPVSHAERTNDIEIVCQKPLRSYGEYIEAELKKSHFLVDVLFPEGGVPIDELLDNISSRGTLYAIVVNNYHQQTNRLDLHVLHGVRKVLENTPLKAAVEYLVSNYADFNAKPSRKPRNILPEQVMLLLRRLVESQCFLSYTEYEVLANYFTQQKVKLEPAIVPAPIPKATPPATKETELADRILSILNKKMALNPTQSSLQGNVGVNDLLMGIRSNPL